MKYGNRSAPGHSKFWRDLVGVWVVLQNTFLSPRYISFFMPLQRPQHPLTHARPKTITPTYKRSTSSSSSLVCQLFQAHAVPLHPRNDLVVDVRQVAHVLNVKPAEYLVGGKRHKITSVLKKPRSRVCEKCVCNVLPLLLTPSTAASA